MANDPRKFTTKFNCKPSAEYSNLIQQQKAESLRGLENLNNLIGGEVDSGLNTLFHLAQTAGVSGTGQVLEGVGINPTILNSIDMQSAKNAFDSADSFVKKATSGDLRVSHLPGMAKDFKHARQQFARSGIAGKTDTNGPAEPVECRPSPYAMDLINYGIKQKFLFVVEFKFNRPYNTGNHENSDVVAALVKQSGRPNVTYEHEEVNMYNFRTKIIKNATFEPIEMILIDDDKNQSMEFLMNYIRATVPITNLSNGNAKSFEYMGLGDGKNERDFIDTDLAAFEGIKEATYQKTTSSTGTLDENNKTVLEEVRLFHVFDFGRKMNAYRIFNPKILQTSMDELNMEDSSGNYITLNIGYDAFRVDTTIPLHGNESGDIKTGQRGMEYQLKDATHTAQSVDIPPSVPTFNLAEDRDQFSQDDIPTELDPPENTIDFGDVAAVAIVASELANAFKDRF